MSKYISKYILRSEYCCSCCNALPPDFDLENILKGYERLFENFRDIREEWGKAIPITSGYRCLYKQMDLYNQDISSTPYSAHILGLALDLDCKDKDEVIALVKIIESVNPHLRIGYKKYLNLGKTFIHIDNAYFAHPRLTEDWAPRVQW